MLISSMIYSFPPLNRAPGIAHFPSHGILSFSPNFGLINGILKLILPRFNITRGDGCIVLGRVGAKE